MSNIVQLRSKPAQTAALRLARLTHTFAIGRRAPEDVFWLKENAEFLGILTATGTRLEAADLAPFETFYQALPERMAFFPQYYRFLVSLCLDLEDLGMPGDVGMRLAQQVVRGGFVAAELSDLQRGEAQRLLGRRGVDAAVDPSLDDRLRAFMRRGETFALPNKKAAYELTHIVFYLSDYGQKDPELDAAARTSLIYAGLLAYLDQNIDLLAEICAAQRFAGMTPPKVWETCIAQAHRGILVQKASDGAGRDAYHEYLVTGWAMDVAGLRGFETHVPEGSVRFVMTPPQGALRSLSECMFEMGPARSADWRRMRPYVLRALGPMGQDVLCRAEACTDQFEPFFENFARANRA